MEFDSFDGGDDGDTSAGFVAICNIFARQGAVFVEMGHVTEHRMVSMI